MGLQWCALLPDLKRYSHHWQNQWLANYIMLFLASSVAFAVFRVVVGQKLAAVSADALIWTRRMLWTQGIWQASHFTVLFLLLPKIDPVQITIHIIFATIACVGLTLYFVRSRRVANTFGEWHIAAYPPDLPKRVPNLATLLSRIGGSTIPVKSDREEAAYQQVASELNHGEKDEGLWLRCFVAANGDENKAKAGYVRERVARLVAETIESVEPNIVETERSDSEAVSARNLP